MQVEEPLHLAQRQHKVLPEGGFHEVLQLLARRVHTMPVEGVRGGSVVAIRVPVKRAVGQGGVHGFLAVAHRLLLDPQAGAPPLPLRVLLLQRGLVLPGTIAGSLDPLIPSHMRR